MLQTTLFWGLEPGDLAGWASVLITLGSSIVLIFVWVHLRRRERRLALAELHLSITTGETAEARDLLGSLFYSPAEDGPSRSESIAAYFKLIWAVQRARNVFHAYKFTWTTLDTAPSRLASDSRRVSDAERIMSWNLIEMARNIVMLHDEYGIDWSIQDEDAWREMASYMDTDAIRRQLVRENSGATSE
ncbi:hypothetical protein ITJ57_17090 [Plantibacter sp. VKM Ac-2880]|uniref:hypothetical protein n=1 Tax=Plantibacter sp. VKM Ac-2880 TaxID=2783827 RepID=UPI00188EC6CB|nr:hypothetical protein [Plantibacter sp. VKM Ac-2880]MBF4570484.1 hypothetical protein [Plantibacter sp. VKM Ac-2880]